MVDYEVLNIVEKRASAEAIRKKTYRIDEKMVDIPLKVYKELIKDKNFVEKMNKVRKKYGLKEIRGRLEWRK